MSSLIFLLAVSIKNSLLEILKKPVKLLLCLLVIGILAGLMILSAFTRGKGETVLDLIWLKGMLFALILLFVIFAVQKGLSSGDLIFNMNDVNLLFVSPVDPRTVLFYGILRMANAAFMAGFFILFQGQSLAASFGIGFGGVLLIMAGFILAVSLLQILSLVIYSAANGRPRRKLAVRLITAVVLLPLPIYGMVQFVKTGSLSLAIENLLRSPVAAWNPVAGWASEGVIAFIRGNTTTGILFFGLILVSGILLILWIALNNPDYYEDVLVASEGALEKKRALSQGRIQTGSPARNVKVRRTGVGGQGAAALFYKHLRESFRGNFLGLWGASSLAVIGAVIAGALLLRGTDGAMLTVLLILMGIQIYLIGTGRGMQELYSHYIYLIPEGSFSKILWSNLEIALKVLVEALFSFGAAGIILEEQPLTTAVCIAVYTLFSLMLLGINFLSLRWIGADISKGFLIFVYTAAVILIMLPGITAAVIFGAFLDGGLELGLGILALWELAAALGCFALSRGILHRCDMPAMKV